MGTLILLSTSLPISPDIILYFFVEGLGDCCVGSLHWNVILQSNAHVEARNTPYVVHLTPHRTFFSLLLVVHRSNGLCQWGDATAGTVALFDLCHPPQQAQVS